MDQENQIENIDLTSKDYNDQYNALYLPLDQFDESADFLKLLGQSIILNTNPSQKFMDTNEPNENNQDKFLKNINSLYNSKNKQVFDSALQAQKKEFNNYHIDLIAKLNLNANDKADVKKALKFQPGFPHNPKYHDPASKLIAIMKKLKKTPFYKDLTFVEKMNYLLNPQLLFLASKPQLQDVGQIDDSQKVKLQIERLKKLNQVNNLPADADPSYKKKLEDQLTSINTKLESSKAKPQKKVIFSRPAVQLISSSSGRTFLQKRQNLNDENIMSTKIKRLKQDIGEQDRFADLDKVFKIPQDIRDSIFSKNIDIEDKRNINDMQENLNTVQDVINSLKLYEREMQMLNIKYPEFDSIKQFNSLPQFIIQATTLNEVLQNVQKLKFGELFTSKFNKSSPARAIKAKVALEEYIVKAVLMVQYLNPSDFTQYIIDSNLLTLADFVSILPGSPKDQKKRILQMDDYNPSQIVWPVDSIDYQFAFPFTEQQDIEQSQMMVENQQENQQQSELNINTMIGDDMPN